MSPVFATAIPPLYAVALGACVGSFLNVVVARVPHGESVVRPRSRCPRCGDKIPGYLNVPIFSWLALGGRCRACRASISVRYPVIEALVAVLFLALLRRYGITLAAVTGAVLASSLVAIAFIDMDWWEIPDEISLPGVVVGALLRPLAFGTPWWDGLAGAALGAAALWLLRWVFTVWRKIEAMGLGDVKLIAMIGAFLGPGALLPVVLVASVSGSVVGIALLWLRPKGREPAAPPDPRSAWVPPPNAVPFGPFLALGGLAELLVGPLAHLASLAR